MSMKHLVLVGLFALLAACSSNNKTLDEALSESELYAMVQQDLDANNYGPAIEKLRALESRYPFGRYAQQASGEVVDEPATVRALAAYLRRGLACGAVDAQEVQAATGLGERDVVGLSQPRSDTAALLRRASTPHTPEPSAAGESQP